MWFWIFMFTCNLLIPLIMIIFGRIMVKHPPKDINGVYGYRTSMSMKNMDTWNFAHEVCGKLWWKIGWVMLVPTIVLQLPFIKSNEDVIGISAGILCMIQCVILIASIFPVEKALKRNFNKDGTKITLCGDNCLECPRYLAKSAEELQRVAELWHRVGWRDRVVSNEEIQCTGCSSHKQCTYQLVECTKEHHVKKCNQCKLFPCDKISTMLRKSEKYRNYCREVCTDEEFRMLEKSFFHKEENLKK